ncbi:MAG: NUDIX hydrolase [Gammaproteobacteria bacterium]
MQAPELTVAAVVEQRGRFLMVEEIADGKKVINQPAGHVEPGETLINAVVREAREETAWKFLPKAINGVYLWQHPEKGSRFLRVTFCGEVSDHDVKQELDTGILRTLWLSRDDLLARSEQLRSPMVMKAIDDYLAGVRYPSNMFQQLELEQLAIHAKVV